MRRVMMPALAVALVSGFAAGTRAADEVYAPPTPARLKTMTLKWVADQKVDAALRKQVEAIWADTDESLSPRAGFQRVIDTFAAVNPEAKKFVASCRLVDAPLLPPDAGVLNKKGLSDFYRNNLRLHYGRYLAQRKMYDEALGVLKSLDPKQVADPATCLFFRAVCEHQLLDKKQGLATLAKLLKSTEHVPVSYANVATLMQFELQGMKNGVSLKKVSLKMRNSDRQLDLARAGQKVQKLQGEIIADLDYLIEKLEQQGGS